MNNFKSIELFYYAQCPYCAMVLQTIKQLGITKVELKNTYENPEFAKFHQEKTGRSTVPCLYIDGEPMFESTIIVGWLKDNAESLK